jgi:hypothetical protein
MTSPASATAPPVYEEDASPSVQWRIRTAKYRFPFPTDKQPSVQDYRNHLECVKDFFNQSSRTINPSLSPAAPSYAFDIYYSRAFSKVAQLICEYQACLQEIQPLQEEDVLCLLLDRFAQISAASVYLEIRRPREVQIYDSEISEPQVRHQKFRLPIVELTIEKHITMMEEYMAQGSGSLHVELSTTSTYSKPLDGTVVSAISLNFPHMRLYSSFDSPPAYSLPTLVQLPEKDTLAPVPDCQVLPGKLQPPTFRVHRCHHPGVEQNSGGNEKFELPLGFPEVVQHVQDTPQHVCRCARYAVAANLIYSSTTPVYISRTLHEIQHL